MDNRSGADRSLGTRVGKQLHDGWVYPCFDRDRNYRGAAQDHPGPKDPVVHESLRQGRRTSRLMISRDRCNGLQRSPDDPAKALSLTKRSGKKASPVSMGNVGICTHFNNTSIVVNLPNDVPHVFSSGLHHRRRKPMAVGRQV